MPETCRNPWNPYCKGMDIALDIVVKGKRLPICQGCLEALAKTSREWSTEGFSAEEGRCLGSRVARILK